MRIKLAISFVASFAAPMFMGAPVAHADVNSYLADLQANDSSTLLVLGPVTATERGYMVCAEIRSGASPAASEGGPMLPVADSAMVAAAQHNLCPDTLH